MPWRGPQPRERCAPTVHIHRPTGRLVDSFKIPYFVTFITSDKLKPTPWNQEANVMFIADRQTLTGLYSYMVWTTPWNQEASAMLIADRQTLTGLYSYMVWITPWNQEASVIADSS